MHCDAKSHISMGTNQLAVWQQRPPHAQATSRFYIMTLTFLPALEASCLAIAVAAFCSAFFVSKNLAALLL